MSRNPTLSTPTNRDATGAQATTIEAGPIANVQIDNWIVIQGHIYGNVTWHPTMPDGSFVRTSVLATEQDEYAEGEVVMTRNTTYTLGKPAGQV